MTTSLKYIEINTKNTYACKNEIIISNPITTNTIVNGSKIQNQLIKLETRIAQIKQIRIFNKICPDNIFANKRIARLKILEK